MAGGAAVVTEAGGVIVDISGEAAKKAFSSAFYFPELMDGPGGSGTQDD